MCPDKMEMITEDDGQWKGILNFDLKIHNIYLNTKGKYYIKLGVSGSRGDLSKVKLYINDSKTAIYEHEYTSEPCFQDDPEVPCQLDDTQFRFEMPEEFSEGEVHLLFETYQYGENPLVEPFKCGAANFLIFPCATPLTSLPSTSADKEVCYQYSTQLAISQLLNEEQVYTNVGQVHVSVLLEMQEKHGGPVVQPGVNVTVPTGLATATKIIIPEYDEEYDNNPLNMLPDSRNLERSFSADQIIYPSQSNSLCDVQDTHVSYSQPSSTHTSRVSENVAPGSKYASPDKHQLMSVEVPAKAIAEPLESSFKKAWTTSIIEKPVVRQSTHSLGHWDHKGDSSAVVAGKKKDSSVGGDKRKDSTVYNSDMTRKSSISSKVTVKDPPLASTCQGPAASHLCGSTLNDDDNYEIVIQVHSACDLPSNALGRPPQPYVTGKTTANDQNNSGSQCATHATLHTTYSPLWEEILVVKVPKERVDTQELILSIVDDASKTLLTKFKLPLRPLRPFYPYHLQLEQVAADVKAKLYVSLLMKANEIILPSLHSEIRGLEVILRNFTSPLAANCTEPLVAVVRVVNDYPHYHEKYLESKPRLACIKTKKVKCPSSTLSAELAAIVESDQYNVALMTLAGEPSDQPKWDQMLFFHGDHSLIFSRSSALVIEYFVASQIVSFGHWQPSSPVGYSVYNLDQDMLTTLRQNNATMGVRIDNIAVKDSPLKNNNGEAAAVNIILRLVTKKRSDHMISPAHFSVLPMIDMTQQTSANPVPFVAADVPQDNTKTVLDHVPDVSTTFPLSPINQRNPIIEPRNTNEDVNSSAIAIIERQTKEIGKHRYAMKRMADDIIQLKSESTRLQAANNRLRLELRQRNENHYLSSLPAHLENTTHAELVQRIVIVKGSLDEQTAINRELRLEIQSLHNQLIKKNEREKEYYKLQDAHKNQQILLQKMQERLRRTKTLEETCKKQEKVIIRLEEILANSKTKDKRNEEDQTKTYHGDTADENRRLRTQLLNYERNNRAADEMDRLHVHDKLHRAEARVKTLEKELMENTRKWARDKAELQLKLSETQMSPNNYGQWSTFNHEPLNLFDSATPDSRSLDLQSYTRRASPKLSPLNKK